MRIHFLLTGILLFSSPALSYNPFKGKRVEVCWVFDSLVNSRESGALSAQCSTFFKPKTASYKERKGMPSFFEKYHYSYSMKTPVKMPDEARKEADILCIISYYREIVYGLSGDMRFEGYFGGADFGGAPMNYSGGGGGGIPGGMWVSVNFTDENPEWQYHTSISLDMYDCSRGERLLTLVRTEESSSDSSHDRQTLRENIEEIFDEIDDALYKRSTYSNYKRIINRKTTVRAPAETNDRITETLVELFDDNEFAGLSDTVAAAIQINENGVVSVVDDPLLRDYPLLKDYLTSMKLQRVVKPDDVAPFTLEFRIQQFFGHSVINGYRCSISGARDRAEVWRILYRYVKELVKHSYVDNGNKQAIHLAFEIDSSGEVRNATIPNSTDGVKGKENKILEEVGDWNFGQKTGDQAAAANVELIFTLAKDKLFVGKRNRQETEPSFIIH